MTSGNPCLDAAWERAYEQAENELAAGCIGCYCEERYHKPCPYCRFLERRAEELMDEWADQERFRGT